MILIDTNVISEPLRPTPDQRLVDWLSCQAPETLFLSTVTVAELRFGVASLPDGRRRRLLGERLDRGLFPMFIGRMLGFDLAAAAEYGTRAARARSAGLAVGLADGYIAAIAAANGLVVGTRNTMLFEAMGVDVINPWAAGP